MPNKLIEFISKKAILIISLIGLIVCQVLFMTVGRTALEEVTGEYAILDMQSGFSPAEGYALLDSYGPEGVEAYRITQIVDLFFPLFYGFFFAGLLAMLFKSAYPNREPVWNLALIGFAPMLFDLTENLGIFLMINGLPERSDALAGFTSVAGLIKFGLFIPVMGLIVYLAVIALLRKYRKGKGDA